MFDGINSESLCNVISEGKDLGQSIFLGEFFDLVQGPIYSRYQ